MRDPPVGTSDEVCAAKLVIMSTSCIIFDISKLQYLISYHIGQQLIGDLRDTP